MCFLRELLMSILSKYNTLVILFLLVNPFLPHFSFVFLSLSFGLSVSPWSECIWPTYPTISACLSYSFSPRRTPLKIICEDILQTSSEADAALSITNMTPSSSYSENEEVISPTGHDLLTPDNLLIQGTLHNPQDSMDVDTPSIIPEGDLPISSSTPHRGPEIKFSPVICCLPTTPEGDCWFRCDYLVSCSALAVKCFEFHIT